VRETLPAGIMIPDSFRILSLFVFGLDVMRLFEFRLHFGFGRKLPVQTQD
jgi:hypothetical protein